MCNFSPIKIERIQLLSDQGGPDQANRSDVSEIPDLQSGSHTLHCVFLGRLTSEFGTRILTGNWLTSPKQKQQRKSSHPSSQKLGIFKQEISKQNRVAAWLVSTEFSIERAKACDLSPVPGQGPGTQSQPARGPSCEVPN